MVDGKGTIGKLMTDETLANNLDATVMTLKKSFFKSRKAFVKCYCLHCKTQYTRAPWPMTW